jgi:hypothetical protein
VCHGGKPGRKRAWERYLRIAEAVAPYGARMDDPDKALGGGMINFKHNGYNDESRTRARHGISYD